MQFLQDTNILVPMVIAAIYGAVKVSNMNFYPRIDNILNQTTLYGIIIMMHAMFGISPISEVPERTKSITGSVWFKLISLLILSFSATRDFEDAILVLVAFLGLVQLLRTKEERKKYPYIIA
jgi:ABC-type glucose/galactose transport system permease subunit